MRHAREAAAKAIEFTRNRQRGDLDSDEKLALAVVRLLEIVGEAMASVSQETRSLHPGLPWREAIGIRNRLIHGYHDIVWKTVLTRLPTLVASLDEALSAEPNDL